MLAGAVTRLAGALYLLSGAKFAVGLLKQLGTLTKWAVAADAVGQAVDVIDPKPGGKPKPGAKLPAARKLPFGIGFNLPTILGVTAAEISRRVVEQTSAAVQAQNRMPGGRAVISGQGDAADMANRHRQDYGQAYEAGGFHRVMSQGGPMPTAPAVSPLDQLRSVTIQTQQQGTSDVRVTNPTPIVTPITNNITVNVQQVADVAGAVGQAVANAAAAAAQRAVQGAYVDGGL